MYLFASKAFSSLRESEGSDNASVRFTEANEPLFKLPNYFMRIIEEFCFLKHENILTFSSSV